MATYADRIAGLQKATKEGADRVHLGERDDRHDELAAARPRLADRRCDVVAVVEVGQAVDAAGERLLAGVALGALAARLPEDLGASGLDRAPAFGVRRAQRIASTKAVSRLVSGVARVGL